jgi:hypothetical protein
MWQRWCAKTFILHGKLLILQSRQERDIKITLSRRKRLGENLIVLGIIDPETLKAPLRAQNDRAKAIPACEDYCNARRAALVMTTRRRTAGVAT